jgi:hypothetical protein
MRKTLKFPRHMPQRHAEGARHVGVISPRRRQQVGHGNGCTETGIEYQPSRIEEVLDVAGIERLGTAD